MVSELNYPKLVLYRAGGGLSSPQAGRVSNVFLQARVSAHGKDVPRHGAVKQLPHLFKFLGLAQNPHELAHSSPWHVGTTVR